MAFISGLKDIGLEFSKNSKNPIYRVYTAPPKKGTSAELAKSIRDKRKGVQAFNQVNVKSTGSGLCMDWFDFQLDPTENESIINGLTVTSLEPEARVFIAGVEIKSITSVTITNTSHEKSVSPGTCSLKIVNINNRYRITKKNIEDIWIPEEYEKEVLFKLKAYSRIAVTLDSCVFSVNDPIVVFLKDRFTPFWRFAFTGFVTTIDDTSSVTSNVLTLGAEDITKFIQKKSYNSNPALINHLQNRRSIVSTEQGQGIDANIASGNDALTVLKTLFNGVRGAFAMDSSMPFETIEEITYVIEKGLTVAQIVEKIAKLAGTDNKPAPISFEELRRKNSSAFKYNVEKKIWEGIPEKEISWPKVEYSTHNFLVRDPNDSFVSPYKQYPLPTKVPETFPKIQEKQISQLKDYEKAGVIGDSEAKKLKILEQQYDKTKTYTFDINKKGLLPLLEKLEAPLVDAFYANIGVFKTYTHIIQQGDANNPKGSFHEEVAGRLPSAPIYTELPRYYLTDVSWHQNQFQFKIMGCQGINPLVTSEFIDKFSLAPLLVDSLGRVGKDAFFDKIKQESFLNSLYPFDIVRNNFYGFVHTLFTEVTPGKVLDLVTVNPRLIIIISQLFTNNAISFKQFRTFELVQTDSESASSVIAELLKQTDSVSWVSPLGDFIFEPKFYDTCPWDWEDRLPGEVTSYSIIKLKENKKQTENRLLEVKNPKDDFDESHRLTLTSELQENQKILKNTPYSPSIFINAEKLEQQEYKYLLEDDSHGNQVIEEKDEQSTSVVLDANKFPTMIEVNGTWEGYFKILDDGLKEELSALGDRSVPKWRRVQDGLVNIDGGALPDDLIKKLRTFKGMKELIDEQNPAKPRYIPEQDFIRQYGMNSIKTPGEILNLNSQEACREYADILFTRYLSEANMLRDVSIFGRPGILLNRPVYVRSKELICTPTSITTTLTYGSDYSTTLQLAYIRSDSLLGKFSISNKTGANEWRERSKKEKFKEGVNTIWKDQVGASKNKQDWKYFPLIGLQDWNRFVEKEKAEETRMQQRRKKIEEEEQSIEKTNKQLEAELKKNPGNKQIQQNIEINKEKLASRGEEKKQIDTYIGNLTQLNK